MIHICLDEFQGLVLDHSDCARVNHLLEVVNLISGDTLSILSCLESPLKNALDVCHLLDTLSHSEAEVSEPLVVESDGPVLAQELNDVRNNALLVS